MHRTALRLARKRVVEDWRESSPASFSINPLNIEAKFPVLRHNLDRVLFSPNVHYASCPRTGRINFHPFVCSIPAVDDFRFDALPPFRPSSCDPRLMQMAVGLKNKYTGSTSSLTSSMMHIYFLVSGKRALDLSPLSMAFAKEPTSFVGYLDRPVTVQLRRIPASPEQFAIDVDDEGDSEDSSTVLMLLGHVIERMLTMEPTEFNAFLRTGTSEQLLGSSEMEDNAYHYATMDRFLVRSQIDCHHPELPRVTFDLKSRGVIATRLDIENYLLHQGYQIRHSHGLLESFEREMYDMVRSLMLKYNFQVRLGCMDGIFVAYHNTKTMFGFHYLSREEMDARLFGSSDQGDTSFAMTMQLFGEVLDHAVKDVPIHKDVRLTMQYTAARHLRVYVEQIDPREEATGTSGTGGTGGTTGTGGTGGTVPEDPSSFFMAKQPSELADLDIAPAGDALQKFVVLAEPVINGTAMPPTSQLRISPCDDVKLQYAFRASTAKQATLREEYRKIRVRMAEWKSRTKPDASRKQSGLVNILRRISAKYEGE